MPVSREQSRTRGEIRLRTKDQSQMTETLSLIIDDTSIEAPQGISILEAADRAGIYIPRLCSHPDLPPAAGLLPVESIYRGDQHFTNQVQDREFEGCRICLVRIDGREEFARACNTPVEHGMVVHTDTPELRAQRRENLAPFLARHPHACLTCAQRDGCSRTQCSTNVPETERCCLLLGDCELQRLADYVGISEDIPRYVPAGYPLLDLDPLFTRDYNLCIGCLRCVRACSELRGVHALGFVFDSDGNGIVGPVSPSLGSSACRFCTACVEVCPTGALMDKRPDSSAVHYRPDERQAALVPCRATCPAQTDVPRYVHLIGEGRFAQAAAVVRERAPFPNTLGHVCFHPCEDACRRREVTDPISIAALKRCAVGLDDGLWRQRSQPDPATGRRVAVIGAGPAGLTAAHYLSLKGHGVTVFEARPSAGGMLRHGVPPFRLPRHALERDLHDILSSGISLQTSTRIGTDLAFDELRDRYDAVVLAVGLQVSRRLDLPAVDLDGVYWGLEFLRAAVADNRPSVGQRVVVVGGGGVAMDAALTAHRLGATEIRVACLETREEMPAYEREVALALEEGTLLCASWGPARILGNNHVTGVELVRCASAFDAAGTFAPTFDESITTTLECDTIILAVGQTADLALLDSRQLRPDPDTCASAWPDVFVAGDIAGGDMSVVHAIAPGRRAAEAADRYLGGDGAVLRELVEPETVSPYLGRAEDFAGLRRATMPTLSLEERFAGASPDRTRGSALVELGLSQEAAQAEASRCLRCDLRLELRDNPHPPEAWLPFDTRHVAEVPAIEGVYQLLGATKEVFCITGTMNLRDDLQQRLSSDNEASFFVWEADPLYTKRESELIQRFLHQHGHLPGAGGELDDLYDDMDDLF